jgi:dienelactone hydrolase
VVSLRLAPEGEVPDGMVLVPGEDSLGGVIGTAAIEGPHDPYFIDRYEVTNRQFKQFVDQGGYQKRAYWTIPFVKDGKPVSWEEAMAAFRDPTGRAGPSTWEGGTYPAGRDDFPVTGVSWYEAAAYAAFSGKVLPTLSHWYLAADIRMSPLLIPASNFAGQGLAKVGSYSSIGPFGTYDMAGNAQEWAWNDADGGFRFILGGAWSSPTYQFNQPDAKPPFDRGAANGFRCAIYRTPPRESLLAPVRRNTRDYSREKPVGEEAFQIIRSVYAYTPRELKASVDEVDDSSPYWRKEKISFSAAYGDDRVPAFVFLPKNAKPPYQALVYHPSAGARSSTYASMEGFNRMEFIIRSGRAVIYPIYLETFDRQLPPARSPAETKDRLVKRFQDTRQSVEYLVSREDIDVSKIGYLGASWGSGSAPVMISQEDRFRIAVLFEGGLYQGRPAPEADPFNFLPRVQIPVLMLNGRYDYTFPLESSQKAFFRWLGTPEKDKRHVVYDAAHDVMVNRTEVVKEVLSWLDQYLGPVAR